MFLLTNQTLEQTNLYKTLSEILSTHTINFSSVTNLSLFYLHKDTLQGPLPKIKAVLISRNNF